MKIVVAFLYNIKEKDISFNRIIKIRFKKKYFRFVNKIVCYKATIVYLCCNLISQNFLVIVEYLNIIVVVLQKFINKPNYQKKLIDVVAHIV